MTTLHDAVAGGESCVAATSHGTQRAGRITPKAMHDRVELDLPPALPRKAG
jgi:hypothetical protein